MSVEPVSGEIDSSSRIQALRRVTRALADRLPAVDTLPMIAEEARTSLSAATIVVALLEDTEYLRFRVVAGARAHELQGVRIRASESLADRTLQTGASSLLHEGQEARKESPRITPDYSTASAAPPLLASSVAVAPIERSGEIVGALLAMGSETSPPFTPLQLDMLAFFADQVGAALASDETERIRADQARELSVLYKASRSVGESLNLQEILESVLDAIRDHLDYQTAIIFLANDEQSHLFVAAERGLLEQDREIQLSTESPPIAQLFTTAKGRLLSTFDDLPEFGVLPRDERIRAAMVAPILSRAQSHGILVVTSSQPENFTDDDLKLLDAVAAQAGVAISNAWLYDDATQRAENAGSLFDLSQRLNSTLNASHIQSLAVESVLPLLRVDSAAMLLYDVRAETLLGCASRGPHAERLLEYRAGPGHGLPGWVFEWETPQAVANIAADSRNGSAPMEGLGISSVLAVPLATRERVLGVLLAVTGNRRLFTVGEMELLYTVANQTAFALSNAELYSEAKSRAAELRGYFRRVSRALGDSMQPQEVPKLFAYLALAMMRGAVCNLYSLNDGVLTLRASATDRGTDHPEEQIEVGQGLGGAVARKGQFLAVTDLATDVRLQSHPWASRERFASYLGVPLREEREVRGIVELYLPEPHANLREEARLLSHFARLARVAERLS